MHRIKNEEGFTLVEIILAFTLLVIMSAAIITMFTTGFSGVFRAGSKSEALFEAQNLMDNAIVGGSGETPALVTYEINFGGPSIDVKGEVIDIKYQYDGFSGTIYYFLPSGN